MDDLLGTMFACRTLLKTLEKKYKKTHYLTDDELTLLHDTLDMVTDQVIFEQEHRKAG